MDIISGYALPIAVAVTLSLMAFGYRSTRVHVVSPIQKFIDKVNDAIATVHEIAPHVRAMRVALGSNGGKSLADVIHRTSGRVNLMVDLMPGATWEASHTGENTRVNPAFEKLLGRSAAEISGHGWKNMLHPDDAVAYIASWESAVHDQRAYRAQVRFVTKSGVILPVIVAASPAVGLADGSRLWMGSITPE